MTWHHQQPQRHDPELQLLKEADQCADGACHGSEQNAPSARNLELLPEEEVDVAASSPLHGALGSGFPRRMVFSGTIGTLCLVFVWNMVGNTSWFGYATSEAARVADSVSDASLTATSCARDYSENCINRTCCGEFTTCYEKAKGWATCRPTCTLGVPEEAPPWAPNADKVPWSCNILGKKPAMPTWKPSNATPSLYCYAVTLVRGSEPELLRRQLSTGTGIFGCNDFSLFSERKMLVGPSPSGLVATIPIDGPMATSANNTWDFVRAWRKVIEHGVYRRHHWTVKADPDSVLLPDRLRMKLDQHKVAVETDKVFFKNCHTFKSIQGPLEIMSQAAAKEFFSSIDKCRRQSYITARGEDWFVGHCLEYLGFWSIKDWTLLDDQYCTGGSTREPCGKGKAAYHPFKTVESYMRCLTDSQ